MSVVVRDHASHFAASASSVSVSSVRSLLDQSVEAGLRLEPLELPRPAVEPDFSSLSLSSFFESLDSLASLSSRRAAVNLESVIVFCGGRGLGSSPYKGGGVVRWAACASSLERLRDRLPTAAPQPAEIHICEVSVSDGSTNRSVRSNDPGGGHLSGLLLVHLL